VYQSHPLKGLSTITNFATVSTLPKVISLEDHPLEIAGKTAPRVKIWTGIYGIASTNEAARHIQTLAARAGKQCQQVITRVPIRDFTENKGRMEPKRAFHTGFLSVERITSEFRTHLRDVAIARLRLELDSAQRTMINGMGLFAIMERFPITAQFLLDAFDEIKLLVHPIHLVGAGDNRFWAGSVRREARATYKSEVRYLEGRHEVR
jgi:hypothetical protein